MYEHDVIGIQRIGMNLDGVRAVFLAVLYAQRFCRKFAFLPCEHESRTQPCCESGAEYITPRLYAHNLGDAFVLVCIVQYVKCFRETFRIL